MRKKHLVLVLALALGLSLGIVLKPQPALAAGDSGCGLGEIIIQKNSKGLQILSWTTNGILLTQPLGITFGTSGCSSSGLVMNDKQIEYFVEVNHDDLSREMAQGQGEKLSTLAALHGCKSPLAQASFASWTRLNYDKLIPSSTTKPAEMVQNLELNWQASGELQKTCAGATVSSL